MNIMESKIKSKQDLIKEANELSEKHNFKKSVVEKMLDDLDRKGVFSEEHVNGMSAIQELLTEMDQIESEYKELLRKIKG